ncbi:MAG: bacteriohopanetetrol glucosamine biosynthesis glycosyltransferase HpnI [Proteobacteria bacterium]|nr:bacteriohopanetetrol glucosamine biosynthesis glycosyltransferase HpnI [Pseudomonadota bacterium]
MLSLVLTVVGAGLALGTIGYLLLALWCVGRYRAVAPASDATPPVSILKPLCGAEPRLYECLRSFCTLDYPTYQIVFGVQDRHDPAIAIVERLIAEFPERDLSLITDDTVHGLNLKASNLVNMRGAARHDLLVVSDSDVLVGPDALRRVVGALAPDVGAATCLYRAMPSAGFGPRLGALYVNDWFLASAVVDATLNEVDYCFGPLTAIRAEVLERIGGFAALTPLLADDFMLGRLVKQHGFEVVLVPYLADTEVSDDLFALVAHELRWARTVRTLKPVEYGLSVFMQALPLAALTIAASGSLVVAGLVALGLALRVALHYLVHWKMRPRTAPAPWLLPLRECLCLAIWFASYLGDRVRWRGRDLRVGPGGVLLQPSPRAARMPAAPVVIPPRRAEDVAT